MLRMRRFYISRRGHCEPWQLHGDLAHYQFEPEPAATANDWRPNSLKYDALASCSPTRSSLHQPSRSLRHLIARSSWAIIGVTSVRLIFRQFYKFLFDARFRGVRLILQCDLYSGKYGTCAKQNCCCLPVKKF